MTFKQHVAVGVIAATLSMVAAHEASAEGLYFAVTGGLSMYDISEDEVSAVSVVILDDGFGIGSTLTNSSLDDEDAAFGVQVGYEFNPYLALEVGYIDLGTAEQNDTFDVVDMFGSTFSGFRARTDFSSSGPTLGVVGTFPFAKNFEVHGRAGLYFSDTRVRLRFPDLIIDNTTGQTFSTEDKGSDTDTFVGIGVGWNINDKYSLRLDFQRFIEVGDDIEEDVDLISFSVLFK